MATYLCGVDLGTTGTKATLISTDGEVLAEATEPTRLIQPAPGWVEQDPNDIVAAATRALASCLRQAAVAPEQVAAVAFDGQMAGVSTVDEAWHPVTPYDSWLDTRCAPYITTMRPHADRVIALAGGPPTFSHGPKILWWKHEHPDVFVRITKFVMPAGYVAGRLTGLSGKEAFIDPTYLHFSCLSDTHAGEWSEELCALFGVPREKLPRIVEPWEVVGYLTAEAAEETGLRKGTPVVAGCGDQAAAMLGAGILRAGMIYDAAGAASVLALCLPEFTPDVTHRALFTARLVPRGLWYAIGYVNGGGLNLRWWRDMLRAASDGERPDYPALDDLAAAIPPGAGGLVFIPHLGGRVTPGQPEVRGAWIGFSWSHGLGHFYRALLEGVAYEYAIYLDIVRALAPGVRFEEVRVVGGGARSAMWNQLKADVLGVPYVQLNRSEAAALGTAILAGYGVGAFDSLEEAVARFMHPVRRLAPVAERTRQYQPFAAFYRLLVEDASLWRQVAALAPSSPV